AQKTVRQRSLSSRSAVYGCHGASRIFTNRRNPTGTAARKSASVSVIGGSTVRYGGPPRCKDARFSGCEGRCGRTGGVTAHDRQRDGCRGNVCRAFVTCAREDSDTLQKDFGTVRLRARFRIGSALGGICRRRTAAIFEVAHHGLRRRALAV